MANTGHSELCGSITLPNLDTSTLQQKKLSWLVDSPIDSKKIKIYKNKLPIQGWPRL